MIYKETFELFRKHSPVSVMFRGALQNAFSAEHLDRIFARSAKQQRDCDLPFSQVAEVLSLAVLKIRPSVNAAYKAKKEELGVSIKSVYNKLGGIEVGVSREMVRDSAMRLGEIQEAMGYESQPLVTGYQTRILDGKHLNRTERRLMPLRDLNAAPLPGQALAVLDADRHLVSDVIPCEDAHAQERSLTHQILQTVKKNDLWIADRNFCTVPFLAGLKTEQAFFIIRRHANLPLEPVGCKRRVGNCPGGTLYEQEGLVRSDGGPIKVRIITIKLKKPTRHGETEVILLSNLQKRISPKRIAKLYRRRWTIETAFQQVATALHGEIDSLAYPKAALFGYCIALVAHNILNVVKAAIATAHENEATELSTFYLADEISMTYRGMMIVLPPSFWRQRFGNLSAAAMASELLRLANKVPWARFQKHHRGPKKPAPDIGTKTNRGHVSTKRVLDEYAPSKC